MSEHRKTSVLFVCTGNICRSPTAEGVFKHCVEKAGLAARITSDSAGTHDYHVGEPPDPRTQAAARRRGYELGELRARRVRRDDFERFDYVLAMDEANLRQLERICPQQHAHKLKLFLEFGDGAPREVPDPYYGDPDGFERVLDLVERAAQGLLRHLDRNN
jgi:protein-tyrosine phosphatase